MEEVRPSVVLLRSVVRERVSAEIVPQRRSPPWEFQRVEAAPDVVEDLADDRWLGQMVQVIHAPWANSLKLILPKSLSEREESGGLSCPMSPVIGAF